MGAEPDNAEVATLRGENDALRAEIAKLTSLVAKANDDAAIPSSESPTVSVISELQEPEGVVVSAPTSSSDGEVIGTGEVSPVESAAGDAVETSADDGLTESTTDTHQIVAASADLGEQFRIKAQEGLAKAKEGWEQVVVVAKETLKKLQEGAAPHLKRLEPYTKVVTEKAAEGWRVTSEAVQKLVVQMQPHAQIAMAKMQSHATALAVKLEPKCQEAKVFVVTKSEAALEAAKVGWTNTAKTVEPHLIQFRAQAEAALIKSQAFVVAKVEPLSAPAQAWLQQMATCFCAPFGGAVKYKGMDKPEYPAPVVVAEAHSS